MQLISLSNSMEDFVKFVRIFTKKHKNTHTLPYTDTLPIPYKNIPDFLPHPLKVIHHEFGNFALNSLFCQQDMLIELDDLKVQDGKITFAVENQGAWEAKTKAYETDPPVYLVSGNYEIDTFEHLSGFLITFCLTELIYTSNYSYLIDYDYSLMHRLISAGNREPIEGDYSIKYRCNKDDLKKALDNSQPVWLNGKSFNKMAYSFYLTEDNLLLLIIEEDAHLVASMELYDNVLNSKSVGHLISPKYRETK